MAMTEQTKKIVSVEILHLDEIGYGPEGRHTRREWREECLQNLLAGKEQFEEWQSSWVNKIEEQSQQVFHSYAAEYMDCTQTRYIREHYSRCSLDFIGVTLSDKCNFNNYVFSHITIFSHAKFANDVRFSGSVFSQDVEFYEASFGKSDFFGATFLKNVHFDKASFGWETVFMHAVFKGGASFDSCIFNGGVIFYDSKFFHYAQFRKSIFLSSAFFSRVVFERNARFEDSIFEDCAYFDDASFDEADFFRTTFQKQSRFYGTFHYKLSNFENSCFKNIGHFEGARFNFKKSKIPSFRGVKIDDTRVEFSDDNHFTQDDFSEDAIKNISFLKRLSDEHGQVDQALNFNAMELRAKRKNSWQTLLPDNTWLNLFPFWFWQNLVWLSVIFSGQFWFCVFTYLYEKISDLGRSFTKPFFYLVILFLASYLFCVVSAFENSPAKLTYSRQPIFEELARVYDYNKHNQTQNYLKISAYRAATEYSLYRSGNFLDFTDLDKNAASINMRLFGSEIEPWWARFFGFFKGIITAILLFLIALGLRNKYRVS